MIAKSIDLDALHASAFNGAGATAVVDRAWLRDVHAALSGKPFATSSAPCPEVRQARILGAIDNVVVGGAPA